MLLGGQQSGMHLVLAGAQHEAAGLVVGCDHNQGLLGMPLLEGQDNIDGGGEIRQLPEAGGGIVAVGAVVNLAAFHHAEEAFVAEVRLQIADAGVHEIGQFHVAFLLVDGIGQVAFRPVAQTQHRSFHGLYAGKGFHAAQYGDARRVGLVLEIGGIVAAFALGDEAAAGRKVHRGADVLCGDVFVVAAGGAVRGEARRRGMIHAHAGNHARSIAGCAGPLGQIGHRIALCIHADGAVIGLDTRGQGRSARSRIRHQRRSAHRGHEAPHREMREVDLLRPFARGLVILLGANHMVDSHAVSNHVEDIFHLRL